MLRTDAVTTKLWALPSFRHTWQLTCTFLNLLFHWSPLMCTSIVFRDRGLVMSQSQLFSQPVIFPFFLDFLLLFSDSDHFFRDPWVPLTFFPAVSFPDKNTQKNFVLTQHSMNALTKPLSEKQRLSESWVGSHLT